MYLQPEIFIYMQSNILKILILQVAFFVFINQKSAAQSYCTPIYSDGCGFDDGISSFTINGTTLSTNSGCSTGAFQFYSSNTASVYAGQSYNFSVNFINAINDEYVSIWIDADKDGLFDMSELVLQTNTPVTEPYNGNITIPANASGTLRMRIRVSFENIATDPCSEYIWGETEDYLLNVSCPYSQTFTQAHNGTATMYASSLITASNIISTGANITYNAGASIIIQPGFLAESGSIFLGKISGCPN